MNETTNRLLTKFKNEEYRYAYDEEFSSARMAMQIQAIRENQELTQKQLAELSEMRQARISELENVNYSMWTVSTLRRLARALGVRFSFKFESWGELLPEIENADREHLIRPRFETDPAFSAKAILGAKSPRKRVSVGQDQQAGTTQYLSCMYPMSVDGTRGSSAKSTVSVASQTESGETKRVGTETAHPTAIRLRKAA